MQNLKSKMTGVFNETFGGGEIFAVRAPGRVNLIGEHTDYNDGFVLPVAIDHAVYMAGRLAGGSVCRLRSMNFGNDCAFDLAKPFASDKSDGWGRYIEGVARIIQDEAGAPLRGIDAVVWGNVPLGSGLSSSAALEVATGFFLMEANGLDAALPRLAANCQKAENVYAGVQCGIMDQFASCLGKEGNAVFLDCRSLDFEYVPVALMDHIFLILNTGVPRGLAGSAYNDRRLACEMGVAAIRAEKPEVKALRDVSVAEFENLAGLMPPGAAQKCRHVVTENERVIESVRCLREGNLARFGELMNASHASLRDDYSVTCRELDLLHEEALSLPGVAGERMTGAGFGGCAVALVELAAADAVEAALKEKYLKETGIELEVYRTAACSGVGRIDL